MKCNSFIIGVLAVSAVFPTKAEIFFNGFASIKAATTTSSDDTLYGYTDVLNFKQESLFALQARSNLGDGLSATAQIIARGNNDFNADFEWAYLSYDLNDATTLSAGRIRIPFYSQSEYIDAGFAYPWLRVPKNVYNSDFNSWDGISVNNYHSIGAFDNRIQVQYGRLDNSALKTSSGSTIDIEFEGLALEYTIEHGSWSGRLGYLKTEITVVSQLDQFVQQAIDGIEANTPFVVPDRYKSNILLNEDGLSFFSGSIMYDSGDYFAGIEIIDASYDDLTINPDQSAQYVLLGKRHNDWTFLINYGQAKNDKRSHNELMSGVSADATLNGVLQGISQSFTAGGALAGEDSDLLSLGVNYGFHPSAVFKFDYTKYTDNLNSGNMNGDADILSVGIDLVF